MAGNVQLSSNFAKAPLGPAQVWWIFSTKKNKHTNGHQPDYLPSMFLTAVSDCFFFLSKAQSWVSRTRASSIRMASLIMEDLRIGWIDKSSVKMSNISKLPWGCTAHCTHAHNLGLEQMRLSQYSAEYFQKVKFLQYLKDQADIKNFQKENVGTRKPHFICISAFCKTWIRRKEIIAIFNFLIENVSEYEIAGRASNRSQD